MDYGLVKVADDDDFKLLKDMVDNTDGWILEFNKNSIKVWTKSVENSDFKMVKVTSVFDSVNSCDLYDVLHDPDYRKEWDQNMLEAVEIGYLNPNNDVSYYAVTVPMPLKNRDFVLQRSWLDTGKEQYIINHSVFHKDYPPRKGYVRAVSYFTGYLIRTMKIQGKKSEVCNFAYISRSDPQGVLPSWLVNKCTQILAPKYVRLLESAAMGYMKWKGTHNPHFKPWHYPEQIQSPKLNIKDCVPSDIELINNPTLIHVKNSATSSKPIQSTTKTNSLPPVVTQPKPECLTREKSVSVQSKLEHKSRKKSTSFMSCIMCSREEMS